jgi:hypothetical protein
MLSQTNVTLGHPSLSQASYVRSRAKFGSSTRARSHWAMPCETRLVKIWTSPNMRLASAWFDARDRALSRGRLSSQARIPQTAAPRWTDAGQKLTAGQPDQASRSGQPEPCCDVFIVTVSM